MTEPVKKPRGFAALSPEKRREIAARGGRATPAEKRSFSRNKALAAIAGKKGGKGAPAAKRSFSRDPELAQRAGAVGGRRSRKKKPA